jgi:hypothetical protein
MAVTLACGGDGSRTTASRDIGSGGGTSRKKGEARALAGCGLGPGAARWSDPRCRGAAGRSGQRSREQREEEGERADGRAQSASGRCGMESERAGPQRRWAELACTSGRKRREWAAGRGVRVSGKKEREREWACAGEKAGPRGGGEVGWAAFSNFFSLFLFYSLLKPKSI